jgi:hypothetical protein
MRLVITLFGKLIAPTAKKFFHALKEPQAAQQAVQEQIFSRLANSEYGKSLGIQSIADWTAIPIVEYEDIEKWIFRQKQSKNPILTPEPILFYEKTSGSRKAAKLIPYTKSLRRSFNQMFCVWAHDLILHGPAFSTGKIYFCISPQIGGSATTEQGVAVGLEDDSEYLDGWLRWFLTFFLVSPPGINRLSCAEKFKKILSQALLLEENLEIISIWSPSFLKVLLDYIQEHQTQLSEELANKMSVERKALLLEPEIPWTQVWPQLKFISCWDSAASADRAQFLRSLFPGVIVQGKGLLATEAPMTIPLIEAQGCVPVLDEVFFEFEDKQGKIHLLHELETGGVYEIILSQKGGLYRYRIGDRVRVSHYYLATPCLEFLGRDSAISDMVGEKLHSEFVGEAIDGLALEGTSFKSLVPAKTPIDRYILLLDTAKLPDVAIARELDDALMRSPHYRQARLLGQLSEVRVLVSRQIPDILTAYKTQSGIKWGDIKHQILVTTPIEEDLLAELEKVSRH